MNRPPPLQHWRQYPATAGLVLAAIAVSLACWTRLGFEPFRMDIRAWHGEPWRLLTSALPHVNPIHLLFNLSCIWAFGTLIEKVIGWRVTAAVVVLFAATSAAEYVLFSGGIGLSGIAYGFFGLLWVLSRRDARFLGTIDAATSAIMVGWFVLCCVLTAADIWRVGNAAHAGGAVAGLRKLVSERLEQRMKKVVDELKSSFNRWDAHSIRCCHAHRIPVHVPSACDPDLCSASHGSIASRRGRPAERSPRHCAVRFRGR